MLLVTSLQGTTETLQEAHDGPYNGRLASELKVKVMVRGHMLLK